MSAALDVPCQAAPKELKVGRLRLIPDGLSLKGPRGTILLQKQVCAVAQRLMQQPNVFVSQADLLAAMRAEGSAAEVSAEGVLRNALFRLRQAISSLGCSPDMIVTVRTVGYAIKGRVGMASPQEKTGCQTQSASGHSEMRA